MLLELRQIKISLLFGRVACLVLRYNISTL
jgi:hypothetical protein